MNNKFNHIEKEIEKKYEQKDKKKEPKMKKTGKSVFTLQKLMQKTKGEKIKNIKKKINRKKNNSLIIRN